MVDRHKRRVKWQGESAPVAKSALVFEGQILEQRCWIDVVVGGPSVIDPTTGTFTVNPSDLRKVRALIDTGATMSVMNHELADHLKIRSRTKSAAQGLGGHHPCEIAPAVVGFQAQTGRMLIRVVQVMIATSPMPMIFGMSDIAEGTLKVIGRERRWYWTLPDAAVSEPPK